MMRTDFYVYGLEKTSGIIDAETSLEIIAWPAARHVAAPQPLTEAGVCLASAGCMQSLPCCGGRCFNLMVEFYLMLLPALVMTLCALCHHF
jgi:hypothetical protein